MSHACNTFLASSLLCFPHLSGLQYKGPIGVAAAAAIASGKKRKHPHHFETNPSKRKRQQTRLLRYAKYFFSKGYLYLSYIYTYIVEPIMSIHGG